MRFFAKAEMQRQINIQMVHQPKPGGTIMKSVAILFVAFITLFYATSVTGQETTGNLEGRIIDETGKPVSYVNIFVTGPNLQGTRGTLSATNGRFRVLVLPVGTYNVMISHISYQELVIENIVVHLGKTTPLHDIRMKTRVHEAPEIVVLARRPLIDPTITEIGANLKREDFEALPLERDYQNMTALLPHANQSFFGDGVNIAGATGLENRYFIDGIDVTDPFRGVSGTSLPYNFIDEVEVKSGGYEAEYRSSLGGVINVVTNSGGNELHGQVFGFFANNNFAGDPRFGTIEPRTGDFAQWDLGLGLGGPIKRDKLWFYAAYNPKYQAEDVDVPGAGFYEDKSLTHIFAGTLRWNINNKSNLNLTVFGDPGERESVGETFFLLSFGTPVSFENPDPVLGDMKTGGVNGSLRGDYFVNDNLLFEASVSIVSRRDYLQPRTEKGMNEPRIQDAATGIFSGGFASRLDNLSVRTAGDVSGTLVISNHKVKAGIGFIDNRLDMDFKHMERILLGDTLFSDFTWLIDGTIHNQIPSVFVQDSWRIHERFRFNAGIRWEKQFLIGSDGDVAQEVNSQFQPRIGFIFQPGTLGSQKIYGSFGRFYQDMSLYLSSQYHIDGVTIIFSGVDTAGAYSHELTGEIAPEVDDLEGQHYDEFTLGYERQVGRHYKLGVRTVYQTLRQGIEDGEIAPGTLEFVYGNPGSGPMADYPEMEREYMALELIAESAGNERFNFLASYVLSRNRGNYPGLFNSEYKLPFPNANASYDLLETLVDGTGLMPNDRTHVFKLHGSYRMAMGLEFGTSFMWASGTPLNEFVAASMLPWRTFAMQRGTAGRTDAIWDWNLRFVYNLASLMGTGWRPRLIADVFHIGSKRTPVDMDQVREFAPGVPNPTYGLATRYQPPMTVRLGMEVDF